MNNSVALEDVLHRGRDKVSTVYKDGINIYDLIPQPCANESFGSVSQSVSQSIRQWWYRMVIFVSFIANC